MSIFDRIFGKDRLGSSAKAAELRGDLAQAAELFGQAGKPDEAARIMLVRADAETDPRAKLQYLAQAAGLATTGSSLERDARRRRSELVLALAGENATSTLARYEISEAARELEAVGEPLKAAEAFARAGDKEGEARALQAAGDVDRLEFLLSSEHFKARAERARAENVKDIESMIACGRRREALLALDTLLHSGDLQGPMRERASSLRARRIEPPIVRLEIRGERMTLVLGHEVILGRSGGTIRVNANAVSREHLRIAREEQSVTVRDLGSRNGTQFRGVNLKGPLRMDGPLDLKLGKEVPLRILESTRLPGAIEFEVAGECYVACLGETNFPDLALSLSARDGWVELHGLAYAAGVEWTSPATLLAGDAISIVRGGEPALRVVST